jgi:hypothetical protein
MPGNEKPLIPLWLNGNLHSWKEYNIYNTLHSIYYTIYLSVYLLVYLLTSTSTDANRTVISLYTLLNQTYDQESLGEN